MTLEEDLENLTPMPEENDFPINASTSQSLQPSPRAKPITDPQPTDPQPTHANAEPKQTPVQQQMPANRSRDRNKGGKKPTQITE